MSICANRTSAMTVDTGKLIKELKSKRNAQGLSLRKLSVQIGVSFSTLGRIERGDGEPDNNSLLRILDWLGLDGEEAGLELENVALVHFRAAKNVTSTTTKFLLEAAHALRRQHFLNSEDHGGPGSETNDTHGPALSLSKPEMEEMAQQLRNDLGLDEQAPLDALNLRIQGVNVVTPSEVAGLSEGCLQHLTVEDAGDWSAMSVPLNLVGNKWVIFRNDCHKLERQRVTYLEECWHILLGHKLTKVAKVGAAYGRTYESSEEHDAFYLAAASLLPEKSVKRSVRKGETAEKIAEDFGTSRELVEYRIKRMGLWRAHKSIKIELSGNLPD